MMRKKNAYSLWPSHGRRLIYASTALSLWEQPNRTAKHHLRGRIAPRGARPSTGPEKRSAPRADQRLAGAVASRGRPPARSLRGRDRRCSARVSLVSVEVVVLGAGERATRP